LNDLFAEREVGDDVVFDGGFEQRPLKPGWIAQMAALDAAAVEPEPDQEVAPEAFDQRHALAQSRRGGNRYADRAAGKPLQNLMRQRKALFDFANPDPDPRVDVALVEHRDLETQIAIRRIRERATGIDRRARTPARHSLRRRIVWPAPP